MKKFYNPIFLYFQLFLLVFLDGCSNNHKLLNNGNQFDQIEQLLENQPDSALFLLNKIDISNQPSEYHRHLYNLFLIHARYKNYIDEDNDSIIRETADFFLQNKDKKYAAQSLYLSGMIQLNLGKIGEAAVSLTKGYNLAKSTGNKFLEAQCARGLFLLHGQILDSSAQLQFAKKEHEAFSQGNYNDWIGWSQLDLATAYSNNGQYNKALEVAGNLINDNTITGDSTLWQNTLSLMATAQFGLHKYSDAAIKYITAYDINPESINDADKANMMIAIAKTDTSRLPEKIKVSLNSILEGNCHPPFEVLEIRKDYEQAYMMLKQYKNEQDTIIAKILHNNISESLAHYRATQETERKAKLLSERVIWILTLFGISFMALCLIVILRNQLRKKELIKVKMEEDLENLRKDLGILLNQNKIISDSFKESITEKYEEIDTLCDDYYEKRVSKKYNTQLANRINSIVAEFNDAECMEKIARDVDGYTNGLYTSFNSYFPTVKTETKYLYLYLMLGFGPRTVSIIMNQEPSIIYNRKSRLKAKIRESNIDRKDDHLKFL